MRTEDCKLGRDDAAGGDPDPLPRYNHNIGTVQYHNYCQVVRGLKRLQTIKRLEQL